MSRLRSQLLRSMAKRRANQPMAGASNAHAYQSASAMTTARRQDTAAPE